MPNYTKTEFAQQTKNWIEKVVIGLNFCPFAKREVLRNSIRYVVSDKTDLKQVLLELIEELKHLDEQPSTETTLLIYPTLFANFEDYLDLVAMGQDFLRQLNYEGVYQLATFHPEYLFADAAEDDPANYTNRSPYPMLHILREASVEKAIANHPDAEGIPQRNITHARREGLTRMKRQRDDCMKADTNR